MCLAPLWNILIALFRIVASRRKTCKITKMPEGKLSVHKFQAIFDGFDLWGWSRKNVKKRELLPQKQAFFAQKKIRLTA